MCFVLILKSGESDVTISKLTRQHFREIMQFHFQFLDRNQSLFRLSWQLEDDVIQENLSLTSHPALWPYIIPFIKRRAEETNRTQLEVIYKMKEEVISIIQN